MADWVFLRHGQSVANEERWLSGWVDTPLTPYGRQQAKAAREACLAWEFERAFCSDLSRAHDTAFTVLEGRSVPLVISSELRERSMGDWAHMNLDTLRSEGLGHRLIGWHSAPPNGESNAVLAGRVLRYLAEIPPVLGPSLIVAHGGLIRVVLGLIDGKEFSEIGKTVIDNCVPHHRSLPDGRFGALLEEHKDAFTLNKEQ